MRALRWSLVALMVGGLAGPALAIEAYQSHEIQPHHAPEIRPHQAQVIQPHQSTAIHSSAAQGVTPYQATELKPIGRAGMDVAGFQGGFDQRLVGTWAIDVPGTAATTETIEGPNVVRRTRVGIGGSLGTLRIQPDRTFRWESKAHGMVQGRMLRVVPRRDADPRLTYWRVSNGEAEFYLAAIGGKLTLYNPGTNLYAATGQRR